MSYRPLGDRKLLFVTGKGGVGKTTIAASLATIYARTGRRVLLVGVDQRSDLGTMFGVDGLTFEPKVVQPNLHLMVLETEASLREYLKINLRIPVVTKLGPLAAALDFVATAAPGVREILTIGKVCYEVRESNFDLVVVDAPATGHVVGYLSAPQAINSFVRVGLIRGQTDWMVDILHRADVTGVVAVTTPEEMPVTETGQLLARLAADTEVKVAGVIMNRMPEPLAIGDDLTVAQAVSAGTHPTLRVTAAVRDASSLALIRRREAEEQFARLVSITGHAFPVITQPVVAVDDPATMVQRIADALADEVL
ncbi:MAG: ArsA family ATPase [Acidobacteria bacterium]|nr:ArsA family ATPase [Acidobacteriota bacterium]